MGVDRRSSGGGGGGSQERVKAAGKVMDILRTSALHYLGGLHLADLPVDHSILSGGPASHCICPLGDQLQQPSAHVQCNPSGADIVNKQRVYSPPSLSPPLVALYVFSRTDGGVLRARAGRDTLAPWMMTTRNGSLD